jgi:hypothetical protein
MFVEIPVAFHKKREGAFECSYFWLKIFPDFFYPRFSLFFSLTWLGLLLGFFGIRGQQVSLLSLASF